MVEAATLAFFPRHPADMALALHRANSILKERRSTATRPENLACATGSSGLVADAHVQACLQRPALGRPRRMRRRARVCHRRVDLRAPRLPISLLIGIRLARKATRLGPRRD